MIELRPCPACRRHVADEAACPFCGVALSVVPRRGFVSRRMSRAAAFAGAALVGCAHPAAEPTSSTAATTTTETTIATASASPPPPPPPDAAPPVPVDAAPPVPVDAAPPVPVDAAPPHVAPDAAVVAYGTIEGTVVDHKGRPREGLTCSLDRTGGRFDQQTQTDTRGRFRFEHVHTGPVSVYVRGDNNPRHGAEQVDVTVIADKVVQVRVVLDPMPAQPCCMPYGAPPARRRVV